MWNIMDCFNVPKLWFGRELWSAYRLAKELCGGTDWDVFMYRRNLMKVTISYMYLRNVCSISCTLFRRWELLRIVRVSRSLTQDVASMTLLNEATSDNIGPFELMAGGWCGVIILMQMIIRPERLLQIKSLLNVTIKSWPEMLCWMLPMWECMCGVIFTIRLVPIKKMGNIFFRYLV